jgi:hypothetical protein
MKGSTIRTTILAGGIFLYQKEAEAEQIFETITTYIYMHRPQMDFLLLLH